MITDYTKQMELIKPHEVDTRINVIGCGALGSWIVFFLLKMGFDQIHVYDFDIIEEHNLPNQMFAEEHIGAHKVSAMQLTYFKYFEDDEDRLFVHNTKITEDNCNLPGLTLCCVDSMASRKELYENMYKMGISDLWIEGRIGIFGAYIYTLSDKSKEVLDKYEETLYSDSEAEVSACGVSQTALPSAVNCASIMIMQLIEYLNGQKPLNKIEYSIPWLDVMKG